MIYATCIYVKSSVNRGLQGAAGLLMLAGLGVIMKESKGMRALVCGVLIGCVSTSALADAGRHASYVEESQRLPADTAGPGTSTTDVDLVDVDGDGDLDAFLTNGTDTVAGRPNRLLINDGHGVFGDESSTRLPARVDNSTKTAFADLDGDGDLDALVANLGPEQLLLNDGTGHFSDGAAQLPPPAPLFLDISADVQLADVDGDGDLDALLGNENPFDPSFDHGAQNFLWLNDGHAHFTDATSQLPSLTDQTGAIRASDVDDDGDVDLVVINRGQERLLINDGTGHFTDETAQLFPVTSDVSRNGEFADFDGDGDEDLIIVNSRNQPLALYERKRGGRFELTRQDVVPLPDETAASLALADLNHDGRIDVYIANAGAFAQGHGFSGGPDRILLNHGRGKLKDKTERFFTPPSDPTTAAAFGDLDGDCDLDLFVGNSGENGGERIYIRHSRWD